MSVQRRPLAHRVNSWPPANRFGVGRPAALRMQPSVPPRLARRTGSIPSARTADRPPRTTCGARSEALEVRVLVLDRDLQARAGRARHDVLGRAPQQRDVRLEQLVLVVAHDRVDTAVTASPHPGWIEPLAAVGRLRRQRVRRQRAQDGAASSAALTACPSPSRVDVDAVDRERDSEPVNVSSPTSPTVEPSSVYAHARRARDVALAPAPATSSSGVKDPQRRPRQLGMGHQGGGGHDLGDAGLVVGAEQRVAARGHDAWPAFSPSSATVAGSSTVPPRGSVSTPPS